AQRLANAGLDYYNHNLDTSPEFYGNIITTRTYQERLDTLEKVRDAGIKVCIVSNNHKKRTEDFAGPLGLSCFYEALKPSKKAIFKALDLLQLTKEEVIILGDQLFTDMTVANRCKMKGFLVDPVGTYGGWFVHFKRKLEIPLRKKIKYDLE
ncbi:MAG: HAD-IIIA family hydrolase, partial [Clostridia bacterium]|nr:HAD-IIIA family hydrolase [Clostridia bacterium]